MTNTRHRRWTAWLAGALAIVGAGILGGWILGEHDEQAEQVEQAQQVEQVEQAEPLTQVAQQVQPEKPPRVNRLANESSPYLQLHKHNPIDWYPWGPEAFERAQRENKMIFLSIGYSSCHWCHVMERESFNDPEIAKILNEYFVCIKVDREEMPEVDEVYMTALFLKRGTGGWPLTMFLTPDRKPFMGGTYYPPHDRDGMIGFAELLQRIITFWHEKRTEIEGEAEQWVRAVTLNSTPRGFTFRKLDRRVVHLGVEQLAGIFDQKHGGFGFDLRRPTKFPQPSNLSLLLYQMRDSQDERSRAMLTLTLDRMARGGIWDLLGGGFHRYSTDRFWLVPHFEKMLYDNAQLARVYVEAFELTQDPNYRHIATSIFKFVENEMTSDEGGFYSALDADTEHEEGKFYAWTKEEVEQRLSPQEFELFAAVHGMTGLPNFFGDRFVLQRVDSLSRIAASRQTSVEDLTKALEPAAQKLFAARQKRPRPLTDTKIMTDWNGLMIAALADGHRILNEDAYLKSAERAATLILTKLRDRDGRLLHVYAGGQSKLPAYLEDHAFFLEGLLALHRATQDEHWLDEARRVADQMIELFWDESGGGFYHTADDQEVILARMKPVDDKASPSGNSAAVRALVELARNTVDKRYAEAAGRSLSEFAGMLATSPGEYPYMVRGLGEYLDAQFPLSLLAAARPPIRDPEIIQTQAHVSHDKLQPGKLFQIAVQFDVDSQWHIYANPPSRPEYVATTLQVTSELPLEELKIRYPESRAFRTEGVAETVAVYGGKNLIKVSARLGAKAVPGKSEIKLALRYQACNNRQCLAPKTVQLILPVVVAAKGESVQVLFPDLFGEGRNN